MRLLLPSIHPAASGSSAVFSPLLFCSQQPNTLCTGTRPHSGVTEAVAQIKKNKPVFNFVLSACWSLLPARPNREQSRICLCLPVLRGHRSPDLRQPFPERDLFTALFLLGRSGGYNACSQMPSESGGACTSIPIYELSNYHQSEKKSFLTCWGFVLVLLWMKIWHAGTSADSCIYLLSCVSLRWTRLNQYINFCISSCLIILNMKHRNM